MHTKSFHTALDEIIALTEIDLLQIRCETYRKIPKPCTIFRWRSYVESVALEIEAGEDGIPAWTEGSSELSTTFGITSVLKVIRKDKTMHQ